jgi:hypothetical protein
MESSFGMSGSSSSCPAPLAGGGKKMFKVSALSVNTNSKQSPAVFDGIDRISPLPEDILCRITCFLDARSLLEMRTINRYFHSQAASNAAGWDNLCRDLWKDKIHVCANALIARSSSIQPQPQPPQQPEPQQQDDATSNNNTTVNVGSSLTAYKLSLQDSQNRHYVSREELCYDSETMTGTVWSFRFKESAGSDWTSVDPWYNGLQCRKMVFLRDGSVKQYIPASTSTTTTDTTTSTTTATTTAQDGTDLQQQQQLPGLAPPNFGHTDQRTSVAAAAAAVATATAASFPTLVDPHMTMTWRFLTRPMDLPTRPVGSYVRFSVGGRDVPTYSVRRSPTGNWGFVMESCWGIYASFELPPRKQNNNNNNGHGGRRRRLRRTEEGAVWINVQDEDDEDNEDDIDDSGGQGRARGRARSENEGEAALQDDSSLLITNEIQWREAFLYNVGARVLPEGDAAADEFDRAWGGL